MFSNGLLDPWSAAGVYGHDGGDLTPTLEAVVLDQGGHHLDLMFTVEGAPKCFTDVCSCVGVFVCWCVHVCVRDSVCIFRCVRGERWEELARVSLF